jgi:hypothetical protein
MLVHNLEEFVTMNRIARTVVIAALAAFGTSIYAQNLVFNGSFEFPFSSGQNCFSGTSGGWSSSGPQTSCYHSNALADPWPDAVEGSQYLYLGQNLAANVTLEQSIQLHAGASYVLEFFLAGLGAHPGGALTVNIGDTTILTTSTPNSSSAWFLQTASFTSGVTGFRSLSFVSPTGGAINLDKVSLVMSAVPEPASWALLLAGVVLIRSAACRNRRALL